MSDISFLTSAAKIELDVKLLGIFESDPDIRRQALTIIEPVLRDAIEYKLTPLRADLGHQQSSAAAGAARSFEGAYVEFDLTAELDLTCSARNMAEQCLEEALDETALALERLLEERAMRGRELTDKEVTTFLEYWSDSRPQREVILDFVPR